MWRKFAVLGVVAVFSSACTEQSSFVTTEATLEVSTPETVVPESQSTTVPQIEITPPSSTPEGDTTTLPVAPAVPPTPVDWTQFSCRAIPDIVGQSVEWSGSPAASIDIYVDGRVVFNAAQSEGVFSTVATTDGSEAEFAVLNPETGQLISCGSAGWAGTLPQPQCNLTIVSGRPALGGSSHLGTVRRNGQEVTITGPQRIDLAARPGETYSYSIQLTDPFGDRPTVITDCGTITVPEVTGETGDLEQGRELFTRLVLGPFVFFTYTPVCDGCGQTPIDEAAWNTGVQPIPGESSLDQSDNPPVFGSSATGLHDILIEAQQQGQDVSYKTDPDSGIVTSYLIDGVGAKISCVLIDLTPPELGGSCVPEFNLIG